ncbi:hypothetical protein OIU79_011973 [Salix purpurea]|uniref:Uncharacterized protein n=1 Tax=Salix purpurea TaxID=77065 RepID=A0A9Q0Q243_SALPP|nr:hypothetical protein OIU79_011973 [Salix purpurea]
MCGDQELAIVVKDKGDIHYSSVRCGSPMLLTRVIFFLIYRDLYFYDNTRGVLTKSKYFYLIFLCIISNVNYLFSTIMLIF